MMLSPARLRGPVVARAPRRWSRPIALVLALAIEALLLVFLLRRVEGPMVAVSPRSVAFDLTPDRARSPAPTARRAAAPLKKAEEPVKNPVPRVPPPTVPLPKPYIVLSKTEFAAADIGALPRRSSGGEVAAAGGGASGGAGSGQGDGPGGAHLYNAEWYVEPARGALALYLKRSVPPGSSATVACRTIERYHVENCVALGESPPGSGLASAMRQASWQFLVRPPRVDGRVLVGSWVRIRFDWTEEGAK